MAIPKSVRQRMINVMYIVLLALLALQIPKEVTQAFIKINDSMELSNTSINGINAANLDGLVKKGEEGDADAKKYGILAQQVREKVAELNSYIDGIKNSIVTAIGVDEETGKIQSPEEVNLTSEILIKGEENGINDGVAFELKEKINKTKEEILALLPKEAMDSWDPNLYEATASSLPLNTNVDMTAKKSKKKKKDDHGGSGDWAMETFDHMPAAGAMAMLSQIQADAFASENKIIDALNKMVGLEKVDFDQFKAAIVAPSSYVLRGETFSADIFLAASSADNSNITITANGATLPIGSDGVASYKGSTSTVGEKTIKAVISVKNKKGDVQSFEETFKYTVADPFASVNPTKMNVFYIGVDNPVTISAAGVLAKDIRASMSGGEISGGGGNYTVRVTQQGTANVVVKDANGKTHGSFEFRVKRIPDPVAMVAGKPGGNITAGELRVQKGIAAVLEGFDFDAKFNVVSFDMVYAAKRQDLAVARGNSPAFNGQMAQYLDMAKPGDLYYFENIKVRGPDGQTRPIPGITFRVN